MRQFWWSSGIQQSRFSFERLGNTALWVLAVFLGTAMDLRAQHDLTPRPSTQPYLAFPKQLPRPESWDTTPAFPNLPPFEVLVGVVEVPGSQKLIAHQRDGLAVIFDNDPAVDETRVFLDLRHQTAGFDDSGMNGIVFHPEFGQPTSPNGRYVYIWYAYTPTPEAIENPWYVSHNRLSRFTVDLQTLQADPDSEHVLIEQEDRHLWHMGGGLFFHPDDGFLYLAVSDEGPSQYRPDSTQSITRGLHSGVLRIDVDKRGGSISHPIRRQPQGGRTQDYYIPSDNPWVGEPDALEEFYAIGLRNPHRMTHDPVTGNIWIGDVGENQAEEINLLRRGANYQWPYREGFQAGPNPPPETILGIEQPPHLAYGRGQGICVIGGFIYRNGKHSDLLEGRYIFADIRGFVWSYAVEDERLVYDETLHRIQSDHWFIIGSLMATRTGDILVCGVYDGKIWRLEPGRVPDTEALPERLSETGAFSDVTTLAPAPGVMPYDVISPLWSDGSGKHRWIMIPGTGPQTQVERGSQEHWRFPPGTVFVKHFDMETNLPTPGRVERLETRFLIVQEDGSAYGVTYRWLEDQSDALLLEGTAQQELTLHDQGEFRDLTWRFPSRSDCLQCHTPASGFVLGVNARQLHSPLQAHEAQGGFSQLEQWNQMGLFHPAYTATELALEPKLVDPLDETASLADRARSYLDSNCAGCHRPGGVRSGFDARFTTPMSASGLLNLANHNLGIPGMRYLFPGEPDRSAILNRMSRRDAEQMPPLATETLDPDGLSVLEAWIQTLEFPSGEEPEPTGDFLIIWSDHPEPTPHLDQPNLVPSMESMHVFWLWYGYFGKPDILTRQAPDPFGTFQAYRFASGDFGGLDDAMSGYLVVTEERLPEQSYRVSAWLRSVGDSFPMRLGMTDLGFDAEFEVTQDWTRFETSVDFEWCHCYADYRYFQVYESMPNNPGWELAEPAIFASRTARLTPFWPTDQPAPSSWHILNGGAAHPASPGVDGRISVTLPEPGFYEFQIRATEADGTEKFSNPVQILSGDPPRLYSPTAATEDLGTAPLLLQAAYSQPFVIEFSNDLVEWVVVETGITSGEWTLLPELTRQTPVGFYRVRLLPKPLR